jgi:capsular polysaccharide transport system permease protein
MVVAPASISIWYLWTKASDQYASQVSFAVRSLDSTLPSPVMDLLGGAADSTAGDSEMLFEYLQSQPLVQVIDGQVDLEKIYNRPGADPVFRLGEDQPIEDIVWYWNQAVTVSYDSSSGIIYVEARAFDPDDAQAVAQAVLQESDRLINDLSTKARNDAVEFALVDLREAEARVRDARRALQEFRMTERSVDVTQDIAQAMALIGQLKGQRAALQADYDSRRAMLGAESPALTALRNQMESLDAQIAAEQARIAARSPSGETPAQGEEAPQGGSLTSAAGAQEELMVDLTFAENMYTSALAAVETARAEARRAQRYLATHIAPTHSEEAEYPDRLMWSFAITFLLLLVWAIALLIASSIRDRN